MDARRLDDGLLVDALLAENERLVAIVDSIRATCEHLHPEHGYVSVQKLKEILGA